MTAANFPAVMAHVFREEGGYVDHPRDPGGATNMGITHITLAEYRGHPVSKADVKALTKAEASEIYRKRYWNVIKGDDLPAGIDLVMMDGSVNSGVGRGPKWVQAALRVAQDGKVGRQTIDAAWTANAADTINAACDARLVFLKSLKTWDTFGRGWTSRVGRVRKEALEMAKASSLGPRPVPETTEPIQTPPRVSKPSPVAGFVIVGIIIAAVVAFVIFGGR